VALGRRQRAHPCGERRLPGPLRQIRQRRARQRTQPRPTPPPWRSEDLHASTERQKPPLPPPPWGGGRSQALVLPSEILVLATPPDLGGQGGPSRGRGGRVQTQQIHCVLRRHRAQQVVVADASALVQRPRELRRKKQNLQGDTPCTPFLLSAHGTCGVRKRPFT